MVTSKKCTKCGVEKDLKLFTKRKLGKHGTHSQCKECIYADALHKRQTVPNYTRSVNLKRRFNMSIDDYNHLFILQKGKCQICKNAETRRDKKGKVTWLSVDHSHSTGEVRGLLCNACNTGLGLLRDSEKTLKSAIKYLKERGSYGE